MKTRKEKNRVKLYPLQTGEKGYWDYYCKNPDTGRSRIALHQGSVYQDCISVPNSTCQLNLETYLKQKIHISLLLPVWTMWDEDNG